MPYKAEAQICLNEARDKIVPCDSPEARANLALPGAELADDVAEKYGLIKPSGKKPAVAEDVDAPAPATEPEKKAVNAAPQNKAIVMPNKDKK